MFVNFDDTPLIFARYNIHNTVEQLLTDFLKHQIHSNNSIISLKVFYHGIPIRDVGQQISALTKSNKSCGPFRIIYENHGTMEEYQQKLREQVTTERHDMMLQMLLMIIQNQMGS